MAVLSIRHKVIIAVAALCLFMGGSLFGAFYFMHQLEEKIGYLEDVSKLEESVLEIRRFEKNYFLYGDQQSLKTALIHLSRAQELLNRNVPKIEALSSPQQVKDFEKCLSDYEKLIGACAHAAGREGCPSTPDERSEFEAKTRTLGSLLAEFSESVIRQKRQSIKETIRTTVQLQLLAFALVAVGLTTTGAFLFTKVLKPLRRLENSTDDIANGHFEPIDNLPPEKEIRQIFDSFNRMSRQLKIREEQLVQSKKLASLGTMLAGVAHEVNNPLSNISSSCEILVEELDEADKEWQKALLRKVLEQVDKARGIVRNLLEFARNNEFCRESFNLKELLENTLNLLHGQIPACVRVITDMDQNLMICADKQRMQQAFMNLIGNAVQAIDGDGTVKIRAHLSCDGSVHVVVSDSGCGIAEEDLSRVFDPFFTTKDVGHGTGLGLFITHDIIVRHGGTIRVDSAVGTGTTFSVRIPVRAPAETQPPEIDCGGCRGG
jgi:two-component system, NtrC family, sensor kinase